MSHLVPIPGTPWRVWQLVALRSAGFAADRVRVLSNQDVAELADEDTPPPVYRAAYAAAWQAASDGLAKAAGTDDLREAVAWQSPHLVARYLDVVARAPDYGEQVPPRKDRRRLMTVASYLQRYTMKNDTIGFFGPVGWARWTPDAEPIRVRPGSPWLARRRVYFEHWAIDAVAAKLAADPELAATLPPRLAPHLHRVAGAVITPRGKRIALSSSDQALLDACDGTRTVPEIAASGHGEVPPGDLWAAFRRLSDKGVIHTGFAIPVCADPEEILAARLAGLPDTAARGRALDSLRELITARDDLSAAAGAPEQVIAASERLHRCFRDLTGEAESRRCGEMYAGRTVVYEDTVRNVAIALGPALLDELGGPLDLVLRSARWFSKLVARAYRARFREIYERLSARTGRRHVPLASILAAATPDLAFSYRSLPPLVARCADELRRQWTAILTPPAGVRQHHVAVEDIRAEAIRRFTCAGPGWSAAVQHSPDLMIAAASAEAIRAGDYLAVLSELHVSTNTLQSRVFVEQAPDPSALAHAEAADHGGRRVILLPSRSSTGVNSRTHPTALHSPSFTYWTDAPDVADEPGPVLPAGALTVVERDGDLVVESSVDGREFDILEMLGEPLGRAAMNGFKIMDAGAHGPRMTIGKLVVSRESWQFEADALDWATTKDAAERYRGARRWRRREGLPERCFYLAPLEEKPMFVDFSSVVLVDVLARAVRQRDEDATASRVTFTELLPGASEAWLADETGSRYTSELRMVVVDTAQPSGLARSISDHSR